MNKSKKELEKIWQKPPVDYYQTSVKKNIFQRIWHKRRLKAVLEFLKNEQDINRDNIKLLDVGCASGWFISQISLYYSNLKCFGIDVYQEAIEFGKKSYPHISFFHSDAHSLPFSQDLFDIVICMNVLEHVKNPQKIIKEVKRVVKPNGLIIIGVDSENLLFHLTWYVWKKFKGKIWKEAHLHRVKPSELEELFKKEGFRIEKKRLFNFGMAIVYLLKIY